jgi:murein DD-endopeptidase MepM/ murein hydrolase activator NlpD
MYPLNLLNITLSPIIKTDTLPLFISLTNDSKLTEIQLKSTQKEVNDYIFNELLPQKNTNWGIGGYLENREKHLSKYSQFVNERRYFHLGIDIILYAGSKLYAPLDAEVVNSEYEEGEGNYGNLVVLKYNVNNCVFYSLFGHLSADLPPIGTKIKQGKLIAEVGDFKDNGNYLHHTHLQVFTEKGYSDNWVHKGYCTAKDLEIITDICPNPIFLLKV